MSDDAFEEKKDKPAAPVKPPKAAKPEKPLTSDEQVEESKRATKLRRACEYANAAKCGATCKEGEAGEAVKTLINQALSKLEAAIALVES